VTLRALRLALAGLLAGALLPGALPETACAGESERAVLVVDTGPDAFKYCVKLDAETVTGTHLIELAGRQHDLTYEFGFGGAAVCMLAGVGPTSGDCFEEYPNFWAYWRDDGSGGWTWSSTGAATTTVAAGDVEGWAWGSGSGPDDHPAPPETVFEDVCRPEPEQDEQPRAAARPKPTPTPVETALPTPAAKPDPSKNDVRKPKRREKASSDQRARRAVRPSPAASRPTPRPEAASRPAAAADPPYAGIGALGVALAVAGGAGWIARRRRAGGS
jgi:hypothetical protein